MARFELNYNHRNLKHRHSELRWCATEAERILWERIRYRKINGFKFRRQFSIGGYVLDFFCPVLKFVIEIDGGIHLRNDVKEYDKFRQEYIEAGEIEFLRFTNDEVIDHIDETVRIILAKTLELSKIKRQ